MNLIQLREHFRTVSGRYDLVNTANENLGADFYINAGQHYLDRQHETQKSWGICYRQVAINHYAAMFPFCRAIKEVWAATTTARWQLEKVNIQDLHAQYFTKPGSLLDSGAPIVYSPTILRVIPEADRQAIKDLDEIIGFADVMFGSHSAYNGIMIAPPTNEVLYVEIRGLFYSPELINDTDVSYWSLMHPEVLIMAAMYELEIVNRNTQGANDWLKSIQDHTIGLGMDLVEELIAEVDQMEG